VGTDNSLSAAASLVAGQWQLLAATFDGNKCTGTWALHAKAGGDVAKYKCAYDNTIIEKVFSKKFATGGSPAYAALKKFKLTNADQELVAKWIAGDHVKPDKAGQKWIAQNSAKVKAWFGK